jgi:predicted O-methyltransferase YrrM
MEHFYENIHGWFTPPCVDWYKKCVSTADVNAHFIEVGSFKGKSSAFMAVEIINSGKKIKFECIDSWEDAWMGSTGICEEYPGQITFEEFEKNMSAIKNKLNFSYIRQRSKEAAKLYADSSLDMVFIDGAHDYDSIKSDILSWLPKIKTGGILSGDDWNSPDVQFAVKDNLPEVTTFNHRIWMINKL